jgi:hypothetical protein
MNRTIFLFVTMICLAFVSANAQNGGGNGSGNGNGNGNGSGNNNPPPQIPIEIIIKGEENGTNGQGGTICLPVSASYTSDTLFIDVEDYSGVMLVAVVNTFTNQAVLQTLEHVSATNNSVEIDISALSHGTYRVDIYLANNEGYEGYFEIE